MSICRFTDGDVYLFGIDAVKRGGRIECCGCWLSESNEPVQLSAADMLTHLDAHRAAGHYVPDEAYDEIRDDYLPPSPPPYFSGPE